ncbi:MAG: chemotaxis-specific protein-glutamate methyltransferase CheB [Halothece sp. Uz-M2-17]|nr:chemotaxis-specific protein-glutamate methyltransferase CheB [Halothece sp. Uz-M2-17]
MTIHVLLVEDSPIATMILKRIIDSSPSLSVVGTAKNGVEGLELIPKLNPDIICTDLHMPKMDGLAFTQEVMAEFPRPILVISASVQEDDPQNVFHLLQAGALEVFPKPRAGLSQEYEALQAELVRKIRVLSGVKVFRRKRKTHSPAPVAPKSTSSPSPVVTAKTGKTSAIKAVVIGSSTGGPQALHTIFQSLPAAFPVPIICVQHISLGFLQGLVDWLKNHCSLKVEIAKEKDFPKAGVIYFPPENQHLKLDRQGRFVYDQSLPVTGHRPSVDVLFESASAYYRSQMVGVLLTGMGRDGANGLQTIRKAGGMTIAQDEATSIVFGMPKEAIALGAAQHILPIDQVASKLLTLFSLSPLPQR